MLEAKRGFFTNGVGKGPGFRDLKRFFLFLALSFIHGYET